MGLKSKFGRWFGNNNNRDEQETAVAPEETLEVSLSEEISDQEVLETEENESTEVFEDVSEETVDFSPASSEVSEEIPEEAPSDEESEDEFSLDEPVSQPDKKGFFKKLLGGLEKTRKSLNENFPICGKKSWTIRASISPNSHSGSRRVFTISWAVSTSMRNMKRILKTCMRPANALANTTEPTA